MVRVADARVVVTIPLPWVGLKTRLREAYREGRLRMRVYLKRARRALGARWIRRAERVAPVQAAPAESRPAWAADLLLEVRTMRKEMDGVARVLRQDLETVDRRLGGYTLQDLMDRLADVAAQVESAPFEPVWERGERVS